MAGMLCNPANGLVAVYGWRSPGAGAFGGRLATPGFFLSCALCVEGVVFDDEGHHAEGLPGRALLTGEPLPNAGRGDAEEVGRLNDGLTFCRQPPALHDVSDEFLRSHRGSLS